MKNQILENACQEWQARQERKSHPKGYYYRGRKWYPDEEIEKQLCCDNIRNPSHAHPYSLMLHCRTIEHVANLYQIPYDELKTYVNQKRREKMEENSNENQSI